MAATPPHRPRPRKKGNSPAVRRRTALFFGSFNPLHIGHWQVMLHVLERDDVDELRLVVTPKNPFGKPDLADAALRLENARRAIAERGLPVTVSDVEFHLPEPHYTIRTLEYLDETEPECEHILVIGADNLESIGRWHRGGELLGKYEIWVYPREGQEAEVLCARYRGQIPQARIVLLEGPLCPVSSTAIREGEKAGKEMGHWKI